MTKVLVDYVSASSYLVVHNNVLIMNGRSQRVLFEGLWHSSLGESSVNGQGVTADLYLLQVRTESPVAQVVRPWSPLTLCASVKQTKDFTVCAN